MLRNKIYVMIILLGYVSFAASQDTDEVASVKSASAKAAIDKAEKSSALARTAYEKALAEARKTESIELKTSLASAMQSGDLAEANVIKSVLDELVQEEGAVVPGTIAFKLPANKPWQSVGRLSPGTYTVTATGRWSWNGKKNVTCGPEGSGERASGFKNVGALVARINGEKVAIGARGEFTLRNATEVFFQCDDGGLNDNFGEINVKVEPSAK